MKATFSLLILMTLVLGVALVGTAIAQPSDAGIEALDASAEPTLPVIDETAKAATEAKDAPAATPEKPADQATGLYTSVKGGEWILAFGFFGMLLGSAARWGVGKKWKFLKSKAGGYTIAVFVGLGTLGDLIIGAGAFSIGMLAPSFTSMLTAMAISGAVKDAGKKVAGTPDA